MLALSWFRNVFFSVLAILFLQGLLLFSLASSCFFFITFKRIAIQVPFIDARDRAEADVGSPVPAHCASASETYSSNVKSSINEVVIAVIAHQVPRLRLHYCKTS
jgi:hypothetical protein